MNSLSRKVKRFAAAGLVLLFLFTTLCGCLFYHHDPVTRPSSFYETRWACRELDLELYKLQIGDMNGTYVVGDESYPVKVSFGKFRREREMGINVLQLTEAGTYRSIGKFTTDFECDEETGAFVCTNVTYNPAEGETVPEPIPETLTFDPVGKVGVNPIRRWVAEEMDLFLESFDDVDDYYRGEIIIDGETYPVYVGKSVSDKTFDFYVTGLPRGSFWMYMTFDVSEDSIVATPDVEKKENEHFDRVYYPRWYQYFDDLKTIHFHEVPLE